MGGRGRRHSTSTGVILEACCDSRESVRNAVKGGALRVEVCARSSLHVGGLTPSPTLVRAALAEAADVVALVRVRSGDFVYTEEELRDMVAEVRPVHRSVEAAAASHWGCLGADGSIDEAATSTLIEAAGKDAVICFHRASDEVLRRAKDLRAVDRVASALERLGCARVLSSGGAATARGGRSTLWALQKACGRRRIAVVVAGGVSEANAGLLVRDTGCTQLHAATALTNDVARAAPTSLFFATEKVVRRPRRIFKCRARRRRRAERGAGDDGARRRRRQRAPWGGGGRGILCLFCSCVCRGVCVPAPRRLVCVTARHAPVMTPSAADSSPSPRLVYTLALAVGTDRSPAFAGPSPARRHPTGTPSTFETPFAPLAILCSEQRRGGSAESPPASGRDAREARPPPAPPRLGAAAAAGAGEMSCARTRAFGALLRRRRRGLVVDGEGAAPAQEGLEAVLPDGALGRVEAERGFRGRRVGGVLEDGPALDDGALLVVAVEQTTGR